MESEKSFERLENKVDAIREDVNSLKIDFKVHMALVEEHVAGDKKIINEIAPIIQEFRYKKERNARLLEGLKVWSVVASIGATIVGILTGKITLF